jgi:hypothetical protein
MTDESQTTLLVLGSSVLGSLLSLWGRTGFDRMLGSESGVPWLISWPRKKLITTLLAESNLALAA